MSAKRNQLRHLLSGFLCCLSNVLQNRGNTAYCFVPKDQTAAVCSNYLADAACMGSSTASAEISFGVSFYVVHVRVICDWIEAFLHSAHVRHVAYRVEHASDRRDTQPSFRVDVRHLVDRVESCLAARQTGRLGFTGNQSATIAQTTSLRCLFHIRIVPDGIEWSFGAAGVREIFRWDKRSLVVAWRWRSGVSAVLKHRHLAYSSFKQISFYNIFPHNDQLFIKQSPERPPSPPPPPQKKIG